MFVLPSPVCEKNIYFLRLREKKQLLKTKLLSKSSWGIVCWPVSSECVEGNEEPTQEVCYGQGEDHQIKSLHFCHKNIHSNWHLALLAVCQTFFLPQLATLQISRWWKLNKYLLQWWGLQGNWSICFVLSSSSPGLPSHVPGFPNNSLF